MSKDIGIYLNKTAPRRHKELAQNLHKQLPGSTLVKISFPLSNIPKEITTLIVFGGDGTVREITQLLLKRENTSTLVIFPSGSQNGFYHSLKNSNSVVTIRQLVDGNTNTISLFYPGMINDIAFNHLADTSYAGVMHGEEAEKHRNWLPKTLRSHTGVITTWIKLLFSRREKKYYTRSFMTSSYVGPFRLYSRQNLYSDSITMAIIEAERWNETAKKLLILLFYALTKKDIPPSLTFTTQKSFEFPYSYPKVNVDGQSLLLPKAQKIHIMRSKKAVRAAALQI